MAICKGGREGAGGGDRRLRLKINREETGDVKEGGRRREVMRDQESEGRGQRRDLRHRGRQGKKRRGQNEITKASISTIERKMRRDRGDYRE